MGRKCKQSWRHCLLHNQWPILFGNRSEVLDQVYNLLNINMHILHMNITLYIYIYIHACIYMYIYNANSGSCQSIPELQDCITLWMNKVKRKLQVSWNNLGSCRGHFTCFLTESVLEIWVALHWVFTLYIYIVYIYMQCEFEVLQCMHRYI